MRNFDIDFRKKEDILKQIEKTALTYTPEWRFDRNNPDIGTALAMIYAEMMSSTIGRFNRVLELNHIEFFNRTGADLLPKKPASGYVNFGLVNSEVPGVAIGKNAILLGTNDEGETVTFETKDDVYVSPAEISKIICVDSKEDQIVELYDLEASEWGPDTFHVFNTEGDNLQSHEMYFCHDDILNVGSDATILIEWEDDDVDWERITAFESKKALKVEYFTNDGFVEFDSRTYKNGILTLKKTKNQPPFMKWDFNERESHWIKITVFEIEALSDFTFKRLKVSSLSPWMGPDLLYAGGLDLISNRVHPFGEQPVLLSEYYIACDEVFNKRGSDIKFRFNLTYEKLPLEVQIEDPPIKWKNIMRQSDLGDKNEIHLKVEEVVWEYYNGMGWKKLFVENDYSTLFNGEEYSEEHAVEMAFECPMDIEASTLNSSISYAIRARVLKISNLYKYKGFFIAPVIRGQQVKYDYRKKDKIASMISYENNLEKNSLIDRDQGSQSIEPFKGMDEKNRTMYLGFDLPPTSGPIKILFVMEETLSQRMPLLKYEYYNGQWQSFNLIDETENFTKTGILTFVGHPDFKEMTLYGETKYWIRLIDVQDGYAKSHMRLGFPEVTAIHMNATRVESTETITPETFSIEIKEAHKVCHLMHDKVHEINVWVNEEKHIKNQDLDKLAHTYKVVLEDEDRFNKGIWVKWEEVEDFLMSKAEDRHYVVDRNDGSVQFSDGINGMIPTADGLDTIAIEYTICSDIDESIDAEAISKMDRIYGFVNSVKNPEVVTGGSKKETVTDAIGRLSKAMKHGNRGVTLADIEDLTYEASRNIAKVKCIKSCNEDMEKAYGHIALIVLKKDYLQGRKYFDKVREQVQSYLTPIMASHLACQDNLHIVEPLFIEINVKANIVIEEFNKLFEIKNEVEDRIKTFLDPISGNFNNNGWDIGVIPNRNQIRHAMKGIKGIVLIKDIDITGYAVNTANRVEVDFDKVSNNTHYLPINGKHDIFISVD